MHCGFQNVEALGLQEKRYTNVISFPALRTGRLYRQEIVAVLFCFGGWVDPKTNNGAERIKSIKDRNSTLENKQTPDFLACSTMSQQTSLPPAPQCLLYIYIPSNLIAAQLYIHMHARITLKKKTNLNCRSLAPLCETGQTAPLITAIVVQLKPTHYTNKHRIHFLNHVL